MPQPDDLLGADTSELTMLGQPIQRRQVEQPQLECFTTRTSLTRETHRTREWVSLSPVQPHRPEIYEAAIVYAPRGGRILEAKSLREYGLSFKNSQAAARSPHDPAIRRRAGGDGDRRIHRGRTPCRGCRGEAPAAALRHGRGCRGRGA